MHDAAAAITMMWVAHLRSFIKTLNVLNDKKSFQVCWQLRGRDGKIVGV